MKPTSPFLSSILLALCLCGCGTATPSYHEFYDTSDSDVLVQAIIGHAQCEVREAVQYLYLDDIDAAVETAKITHKTEIPKLDWLKGWDAQITLVMTVDEKTALNPSVALTPPLESAVTKFADKATTTTVQTQSFGIGVTGSVDATRKGTVSWLVNFSDLTTPEALQAARVRRDQAYDLARQTHSKTIQSSCGSGKFIQGDLQIRDWLYSSLLQAVVTRSGDKDFSQELSAEAAAAKKDVLQDEITFVVLYGGNANPVWKLLRVSADSATTPLVGVQRTRTEDLLVTMGPAAPLGLSPAAQNQELAGLIGIAVANAIRNTQ